MLDGRVARLGGHESAFGREFDSLADIISFGIAPALLVFKIVLAELPARLGWMIGFVYLVCGAMRLARFNTLAVQPSTTPRSKDFSGFPIPAAAGLVASVTLLLLKYYESDRVIGNFKYALAALLLFLSFMMFSQVSYPSFKTFGLALPASHPAPSSHRCRTCPDRPNLPVLPCCSFLWLSPLRIHSPETEPSTSLGNRRRKNPLHPLIS